KVVEGLTGLKIGTATPSLVVNGASSAATERSSKNGANSQTPSDDNSQRADSNSELGTKPPSLDGKSITSGTTFGMDEKESLRPDDSASVMAAAEDDDASLRGSLVAGSRGSEMAARFHRLQLGDMPPRTLATHVPFSHQIQGVATPQSGNSDKQVAVDSKLPLHGTVSASGPLNATGFYNQNPDEKLLDAMKSPKDRLFLLKLEQEVIHFVQNSKEPFMDLPPSNSFCRMLTHKLADYYHMTHSFEAVAGSVRIYRTPFCRIPPLLSTIEVAPSQSSSPAPAILPKKIMRRGEGDLGTASASPSKPTSEDGSDGKEKGPLSKEKLTREEREEAYNRARERIFGTIEKIETATPEGEDSNGVSRASSVSAKASNLGGKKKAKQRREDAESWDSRSNYAPVAWGSTQNATWAPMMNNPNQQFFPAGNDQYNGQYQQPLYGNGVQPVFGAAQSYPQPMANNAYVPAYNGMPTSHQRYPPPNPAPMGAPYGSPMQSMAQQPWQQNYPQPQQQNGGYAQPQPGYAQPPPPTYNQPTPQAQFPPRSVPPPTGIPYAYGQLPANANPKDPKSQHPIPGSYKGHGGSFNPKSSSFVPGPNGGGMGPMQAPMQTPMQAPIPASMQGPHPTFYPGSGSPQFNSPHMSYSGYQQPIPPQHPQGIPPPAVYGAANNSYGMVRQGSNNSIPPYHAGPLGPPHGPQSLPPNPAPNNHIHHNNGKPVVAQGGPAQAFNHLPNYGNPATLPQKPSA
ncbi:hypothetical protein GQ53DRAFT_645307, partial [Thozetella sp. PMI_491]